MTIFLEKPVLTDDEMNFDGWFDPVLDERIYSKRVKMASENPEGYEDFENFELELDEIFDAEEIVQLDELSESFNPPTVVSSTPSDTDPESDPDEHPIGIIDEQLPRVYVGVDGEGYWDTKRKTHIYDLLTIGEFSFGTPGRRLTQLVVYKALTTVYRHYKARGIEPVFEFYFGNYDITQWIRGNDDWTLEQLNNRDARTTVVNESKNYRPAYRHVNPVRIGDYGHGISSNRFEIDWLVSHWFSMRTPTPDSVQEARLKNNEKLLKWDTINIYDCGEIFKQKFSETIVSLLGDGLSEAELAIITDGKADRDKKYTSKERAAEWDEIVRYNRLEVELLSRALFVFYENLNSLFNGELSPELDGPGKLAGQWLEQNSKNGEMVTSWELAQRIGAEAYQYVNDGYSGGWFETYAHGIINRPVYSYDINSAYPSVIKELPSLKNCRAYWVTHENTTKEQLQQLHKKGELVFVEVSAIGTQSRVGGLNYRYRNSRGEDLVERPSVIRKVQVELGELNCAVKNGLTRSDWVWSRALVIELDHTRKLPFVKIEKLYKERLSVGKKTPKGLGIKYVMNSIYGKMSQSIGSPKWSNPVYAALITGRTRMILMDAIGSHPTGIESLIRVETDSVFFDTPHPTLPISNALGEWESKVYGEGIWSLKPGIYGNLSGQIDEMETLETNFIKSRGISEIALLKSWADKLRPALVEMTEQHKWDETYGFDVVESFTMLSLPQAYAENRLRDTGEFVTGNYGIPENQRNVNFAMGKRYGIIWNENKQWFEGTNDCMAAQLSEYVGKQALIGNLDLNTKPKGTRNK